MEDSKSGEVRTETKRELRSLSPPHVEQGREKRPRADYAALLARHCPTLWSSTAVTHESLAWGSDGLLTALNFLEAGTAQKWFNPKVRERGKLAVTGKPSKKLTEADLYEEETKYYDEKLVEVSFEIPQEGWTSFASCSEAYLASAARKGRTEVSLKSLTAEKRKELVTAKDKEIQNWLRNSAVEAAARAGLRGRQLMRMRWVLTTKSSGAMKARLVVQGFTDPDLGHLRRESPMASRRARQTFLTLSASLGLHIHKGDVTSAFLQGGGTELERDVLCEPVKELSDALNLKNHEVVRLRKAVYGLINAPRQWWKDVQQTMGELGWTASSIEPCLWKMMDTNGQVIALCTVHVDDFLIAIKDDKQGKDILDALKAKYTWGSWEDQDFVMCGVRVRQLWQNGAWGQILLDQEEYVMQQDEISIPYKLDDATPLDAKGKSEMHSMVGALLWIATQTMPWIAAPLSITQSEASEANIGTLRKLNKILRTAKATRTTPMVLHRHIAPCVVTYSDAAWGCRRDGSSQGGYLCFMADREFAMGTEGPLSLLGWGSGKLTRVARSSLAAEVQAATDGQEESEFIRLVISDLLFGPLA